MMKILLLEIKKYLESETKEEHVESFCQTLYDAFKQFHRLWNDYKELQNECKNYEKKYSDIVDELANVAKNTNLKSCGCNAQTEKNELSKKDSMILNCDSVSVVTNEVDKNSKTDYEQNFQIFSQDFYSQGLEESFINKSTSPVLQETKNLTPKRSKSPIFSSKKGKPRIISPKINSPTVSEKSVVILNEFTDRTISNCEEKCTSAKIMSDITNPPSTIVQLPSSIHKASETFVPKNIIKWGISTTCNVKTDVIPGTRKKLKQSKLFNETAKLTDLSNCDDVCINDLFDHPATVVPDTAMCINYSQSSQNCLDDSLIQVSPTHKKGISKIRQKILHRNKSSGVLQQKFNTNDENTKTMKSAKNSINKNIHDDSERTDTDVTIFEPKLASTQLDHRPSYSNLLKSKILSIKDKLHPGNQIDFKEKNMSIMNKSEVDDETLFVENLDPMSELEVGEDVAENDFRNLKQKSTQRIKLSKNNSDGFRTTKKKKMSPTYDKKKSPISKPAEEVLHSGWKCIECQKYYEGTGLPEKQLQIRKNRCFHGFKFEKKKSQEGYWDPDFSDTFHSTVWSDD